MREVAAGPSAGLAILVDPCQGCGACCEYTGAPPGYAPAYESQGGPPSPWLLSVDGSTWQAMPPALRDTLDAYYRAVHAGEKEDRERRAEPCLWYDPVTRRCLHYDWRPSACRDFVPGSDDCMAVREYAGR